MRQLRWVTDNYFLENTENGQQQLFQVASSAVIYFCINFHHKQSIKWRIWGNLLSELFWLKKKKKANFNPQPKSVIWSRDEQAHFKSPCDMFYIATSFTTTEAPVSFQQQCTHLGVHCHLFCAAAKTDFTFPGCIFQCAGTFCPIPVALPWTAGGPGQTVQLQPWLWVGTSSGWWLCRLRVELCPGKRAHGHAQAAGMGMSVL